MCSDNASGYAPGCLDQEQALRHENPGKWNLNYPELSWKSTTYIGIPLAAKSHKTDPGPRQDSQSNPPHCTPRPQFSEALFQRTKRTSAITPVTYHALLGLQVANSKRDPSECISLFGKTADIHRFSSPRQRGPPLPGRLLHKHMEEREI
jgi:hypothetical protein